MRKLQKIISIILAITIVASSIIGGMMIARAEPVADSQTIVSETTSNTTTATTPEVSDQILDTRNNSVTNSSNSNTTIDANGYNASVLLSGMDKYQNVDDVVFEFQDETSSKNIELTFSSKNDFICNEVLPAGKYSVTFKSEANGNEVLLTSYAILVNGTENEKVTLNVDDVVKSESEENKKKNNGFFSDFLRNNMIFIILLLVACIAYIIVKQKNEKKMTS